MHSHPMPIMRPVRADEFDVAPSVAPALPWTLGRPGERMPFALLVLSLLILLSGGACG